ncbi:MAG: nucleoside triphosphate pyrophosphohydrolase [Aminobacterium sp.]|jgi:MazG family protein|uniref:nucleoside triphosphate pyrophosphohydrolase n=1 Tax=Aminobacterium sp. TaxID=1872491 RepID=UPI001BD02025|nr:nucleoside triphosphate pyrophosphohydrolase [Aminobacterium sp.]MDD3707361.1 nucleoside triphosphate pyrophosphohydrolase [Aminobacterium sp.]MEA4878162.1 nucleoside triphosphate pyrophosphohydrolase [Aminobacterium sp.]
MSTTVNADLERLVSIMARLRAPEGCPWDREQTFETLRSHIIEEAYELVDAISQQDIDEMKEEAGDVLLQIVFVAQLAREQGFFDIKDVISEICDKLIRRHPHVFGEVEVNGSADVLANWEKIKVKEKSLKKREDKSVLAGIPESLPPLLKAYRIQAKVSHVGFDWEKGDIKPVTDKIKEELSEVEAAVNQEEQERVEEELGDLFFAVVNLSRHLGVNPDIALQRANKKFEERFRQVEKMVHQEGREWEDYQLKDLDCFWNEAKRSESSFGQSKKTCDSSLQ